MSKLPNPSPRTLAEVLQILRAELKEALKRSPFFDTGLEPVDPGQIIQDGGITITAPGALIVDGGDVILLSPDLVEVFRLGVQQHGDRGLTIRRDDGSVALEIRREFGPDDASQVLRFRDRVGRVIGGDSILSFTGFDAPHVPITWEQSNLTAAVTRAQSTSSTSFVPLFEHRGYHQNPSVHLQVYAWCSDGTTAGEVQVYDRTSATYLTAFLGPVVTLAVPAGTITSTLFTLGAVVLPGQMSDEMSLEIHARRTAGTGSLSVAVARSIGRGF